MESRSLAREVALLVLGQISDEHIKNYQSLSLEKILSMLAFALDITQNKPKSSKESDDDELKQYMDYQRKLNHENLVRHSLEFAKKQLEKNIESSEATKQSQFLKTVFL